MGLKCVINGYTAWSNVRLVKGDCESNDILKGLMHGRRLKVLLQELTGIIPKDLDSMENLTSAQKSTRVNWFIDYLKRHDKLPGVTKVDSALFSLCMPDEVFPVFQLLVNADITAVWKVARIFQKKVPLHVIIAEPLELGPLKITQKCKQYQAFYTSKKIESYKRNHKEQFMIDAPYLLIGLINGQLKLTSEGTKLLIKGFDDLLDSRVLCTLLNSFIPGTFTSEVLLNDRWTINLVLDTASEMFRITCEVNSHDLYENDEEGLCAFMAYFITSGFQFVQAHSVIKKVGEIKQSIEDLQTDKRKVTDTNSKVIELIEKRIASRVEELKWIQSVYDCEACKDWIDHVNTVQAKVRGKIAQKMEQCFDMLTVVKPMTINQLCEEQVIDLSLTGGNGLYLSSVKEKLWPERKVVIYDTSTGEFCEDFSGKKSTKGSVREMLEISDCDIVQITPSHYTNYEIYFESPSRNKILTAGTKFLYQVFPGTSSQCKRLLLRASQAGDMPIIKKLIVFFSDDKEFINCQDYETGNTALHLACRQGNMDVASHLLENGANVNIQNNAGSTSFFLSTEGLHKQLSQLLLEWGVDIHIKNKMSKKALELVRNEDLKQFLEEKNSEYEHIQQQLTKGNVEFLEELLKDLSLKKKTLASLKSRLSNGETLFHISAWLGSHFGIEFFFSNHINPNLLNARDATPLHRTTNPGIIQNLIDHGANVNMVDEDGNAPLHLVCTNKAKPAQIPIAINVLVSNGAQLDVSNKKGWLPIHSAASHGMEQAIEMMISLDKDGALNFLKDEELMVNCPSLIYLAIVGHHLPCAHWLFATGYRMKRQQANELLFMLLTNPPLLFADVVDTMKFLLEGGADPNAQYSDNNSPLHLVSPLVHLPELGELLIDAGALIDSRNKSQSTPLMFACKHNNLFLARILIDKGADCHALDVKGKYPFDYVEDHNEWIESGHFQDNVRALLKAFCLRQARDVVKSIAKTVNTNNIKFQ